MTPAQVPYAPLPPQGEDVEYAHGPDSFACESVTAGTTQQLTIEDPAAYPGTVRSVWVYVPHGVPVDRPARCTIFQDGGLYLDPSGVFRAGIALDNLVAAGAVPPMVGIFVDPGVFPDVQDEEERRNRNREYDAADSTYADFLVDEVLPRVADLVALSADPRDRALVGGSSGGNGSFTAAWHRPDAFGRAVCLGSSFAQMPGGNPYPTLVPTSERRPMRVLLTAAHHDLQWDQPEMNWFAETLRVAAALAAAGYDMRLVLREGGHNMVNGGAILPDALRWVWSGD